MRSPLHRMVPGIVALAILLSLLPGSALAGDAGATWSNPTGINFSWGGLRGEQIQQAFMGVSGGDAAKAQQLWEAQHRDEERGLPTKSTPVQFIYTSDAHYGITRSSFAGAKDVDSHSVNASMVGAMNALPSATLPCNDGGINACQQVGPIDFVVETGDIANRSEAQPAPSTGFIQSAAESWKQFEADYIEGMTLKDRSGSKPPLYLVPGNHDVTNAIGFYKPMDPKTDATSVAQMYNLMVKPEKPVTAESYDYSRDKVFYSTDRGGVHFQFINMWPDSAARSWMEEDLKKVSPTTPVLVFTHDQPDAEAKHFTDPNPPYDINSKDKFENLLVDKFADGTKIADEKGDPIPSTIEQRALVAFLKSHKNIVGYFHGNDNENQFYTYSGPDNDVALNVFRVDSPMKGNVSSKDDSKLSFQLVTIDPYAQNLTAREYLWNQKKWGASTTVSLAPRTR